MLKLTLSLGIRKIVSVCKQIKKIVIILGVTVFMSAGSFLIWQRINSKTQVVKIGNAEIMVDVADESAEITQGLSGRDRLNKNQGMLFIFSDNQIPNFWMKDMKFPIDIVWLDANKTIVAITPSLAIETYPQTFSPPSPVRYVLEVNSGLSALNGWLPGDTAEIKL